MFVSILQYSNIQLEIKISVFETTKMFQKSANKTSMMETAFIKKTGFKTSKLLKMGSTMGILLTPNTLDRKLCGVINSF